MYRTALLRPDWTPATIALMVLGFVVFWPLGLAMLAYILFGERLQAFKHEANEKVDGFSRCFRGGSRWRNNGWAGHHHTTGNMAFDDWRKAELDRIEEERRKLDEMRAEFDTYMRELRRARDQEEFDRFMRARNDRRNQPEDPQNGFSG
jgi:biopolymer transport protein ExbB/TolQ